MNVEAEIEDLKDALVQLDGERYSEMKTQNVEIRKLWKRMKELEKRIEGVIHDLWDQEIFLVRKDATLEDRIDLLVKVTRRNQNKLERLVQLNKAAKGGEK